MNAAMSAFWSNSDNHLPPLYVHFGKEQRTTECPSWVIVVYLDKEKTGVVIDSNSATAIIVAQPTPSTYQIMDDEFLPFLSFWSSESHIEISVGISGLNEGNVRKNTCDVAFG